VSTSVPLQTEQQPHHRKVVKVTFNCGCLVKLPKHGDRRSLFASIAPCRDHSKPFDQQYRVSQAFDAKAARDG
jgi:hypothetical protein